MSQRDESPPADDRVREQARRLAARLEPRVNQLAREIVERQRAEIPGFDRLPGDMRDLEIAATTRHAIRGFLRYAQGLPYSENDAEVFRERAAQRAEEGVSLAKLLRSYHIGVERLMDALSAVARPGEEAALLRLGRQQLTALNATVEIVTEAYLAALADQQVAARELARALIHGEAPEQVADRYGLVLEPGYLVLSVRAAAGGRGAEAAQEPVAVRRLLRQVVARLAPLAEGRALSLPDEAGGHLLLPGGTRHADLVRQLATGLPQPPIVGTARAATPADVPAAAARARRLAAIAPAPGAYRIQDLLLDYHLAQPADSAAELTALLEPLERQADLLTTLAAFLACDLDRRRTGQALQVHPNTVDNRLARITRLTAVDPHTTHGVQLFGAALTLRRLGGVNRPGQPASSSAITPDSQSALRENR
ncbi:helix-turn-helix domain-containing protein [Kitasatospora sp. NBC_01266]|uniref:helix-turn-helix domain-containing protein n=1 Tax=Kitasatospora sp. NBC_01266 TaxID=2903572 RepID=UPI002E35AB03|nr:helix-turn-helix domain-containing protein [Kitasatospora sp. NBC_01266]